MNSKFLTTVTLSLFCFSVALISCNKQPADIPVISQNYTPPTEPAAATPAPAPTSTSSDPGLRLIEGADCLACHKIEEKLIGPSYKDVAAKYTDKDLDLLAEKIITGGKGNWGDVEMTPHPDMSKDNAKAMVKYILSLKK